MGKLNYLSHSKPKFSYLVSIKSPFMQALYEEHMGAVNCIMRYLKTTQGIGLMFRKASKSALRPIPTQIG